MTGRAGTEQKGSKESGISSEVEGNPLESFSLVRKVINLSFRRGRLALTWTA